MSPVTYEISVEARPEQHAAVVRATVSLDGLSAFLGAAFGEVGGVLAKQGLFPVGPPLGRYRPVERGFEVEAGFPTTRAVVPDGRVEPIVLPGGDIAETVHIGAYERVPAAYGAVMEWLGETGRVVTGDPWEMYLDGPDVADPRTVVCFPCTVAD
jgi:effector-binding domain-containing protein